MLAVFGAVFGDICALTAEKAVASEGKYYAEWHGNDESQRNDINKNAGSFPDVKKKAGNFRVAEEGSVVDEADTDKKRYAEKEACKCQNIKIHLCHWNLTPLLFLYNNSVKV